MKQRSNNRGPSNRRPSSSHQGTRSASTRKPSPPLPFNKSPKTSSAMHTNVGSTKIMRKAGFSGKLHRGHVIDAATDFATSCAVKDQCGACVFVNTNYADSLRSKFTKGIALLKAAGVLDNAQVLDPMPSPTPLGYRSYFKLAVRPATSAQIKQAEREGLNRRFAMGLFVPGTHQVSVDMLSSGRLSLS